MLMFIKYSVTIQLVFKNLSLLKNKNKEKMLHESQDHSIAYCYEYTNMKNWSVYYTLEVYMKFKSSLLTVWHFQNIEPNITYIIGQNILTYTIDFTQNLQLYLIVKALI